MITYRAHQDDSIQLQLSFAKVYSYFVEQTSDDSDEVYFLSYLKEGWSSSMERKEKRRRKSRLRLMKICSEVRNVGRNQTFAGGIRDST